MRNSISIPLKINLTAENINTFLFKALFLILAFYNFHRYLFKYGSADFTSEVKEYTPTPIQWQLGKYIIVAFIMAGIYFTGKYNRLVKKEFIFFYLLLTYILLINIASGIIYKRVINFSLGEVVINSLNFDELEYIVFGFFLLPMVFLKFNNKLLTQENLKKVINLFTWISILSNIIVIINYFVFDILPFHSFKGTSFIRFGGFWDDPNGFSIINCFFLFNAFAQRNLKTAIPLIINIILAISFTGYVLLFTIIGYFMFRNPKMLILGILFLLFLAGVAYANIETIQSILELKKGSLEAHANTEFNLVLFPLLQPLIFHETWYFSFNINYPPFSYLATSIIFIQLIKFYFIDSFTIQKSFFIIFFIASFFLPVVYIFPLNFILLFFGILFLKNIKF